MKKLFLLPILICFFVVNAHSQAVPTRTIATQPGSTTFDFLGENFTLTFVAEPFAVTQISIVQNTNNTGSYFKYEVHDVYRWGTGVVRNGLMSYGSPMVENFSSTSADPGIGELYYNSIVLSKYYGSGDEEVLQICDSPYCAF